MERDKYQVFLKLYRWITTRLLSEKEERVTAGEKD